MITLIRHGQTDYNVLGIRQGDLPVTLSALGRTQARKCGQYLSQRKTHPYSCVISSPLARAVQTATIISENTGLDLITDPRLTERAYGVTTNTTENDRQLLFGPDWFERPEMLGIENDASVAERMKLFLSDYCDHNIIVVTHGCCIRHGLHAVLGWLPDSPKNTAISQIRYTTAGWSLLKLHDMTHLQERPRRER